MSEPTMHALGPKGTFCELAAQQVLQQLSLAWRIHYCSTLEATVAAAGKDHGGMATAPIENSRTGTVAAVQDAILSSDVRIVGELNLIVRFNCLSEAPLADVKRVFVQPVAEAQCLDFLAGLSGAEVVAVRSNADALARLEASNPGEGPAAAIVPGHCERNGRFHVIRNVQTGESNVTRFLALQSAVMSPLVDYTLPKTSIVVEPRANRPGLLREIGNVAAAVLPGEREHGARRGRAVRHAAMPQPRAAQQYVPLFHQDATADRADLDGARWRPGADHDQVVAPVLCGDRRPIARPRVDVLHVWSVPFMLPREAGSTQILQLRRARSARRLANREESRARPWGTLRACAVVARGEEKASQLSVRHE
jgi:prephenate dehydratase